MTNRFDDAISQIDAANAADPNHVSTTEGTVPAEFVYGQRMSAALDGIAPDASELLKLAARAQHIRRWEVPRSEYPMTRAGYHRWRNDLKRRHAEWAGEILAGCGYPPQDIDRVGALIRKEGLGTDPETQALEDAACLVFLEHYATEFAAKHDTGKVVEILRKTLTKMSEHGRTAAHALPLPDAVRQLVAAALQSRAPAP